MEVAGIHYTRQIGSDLDRDGMYVEIPVDRNAILEIFYSDQTRDFCVNLLRKNVPLEIVEWAISVAREKLPPSPITQV